MAAEKILRLVADAALSARSAALLLAALAASSSVVAKYLKILFIAIPSRLCPMRRAACTEASRLFHMVAIQSKSFNCNPANQWHSRHAQRVTTLPWK
jgi:hypothetical protein